MDGIATIEAYYGTGIVPASIVVSGSVETDVYDIPVYGPDR